MRAHLVGDNGCKRGFAQARRAAEQNMISRLTTSFGCLDHDGEAFLHLGLTQVIAQILRAQAAIQNKVFLNQIGGSGANGGVEGTLRRSARLEQHALYFEFTAHGQLASQSLERILQQYSFRGIDRAALKGKTCLGIGESHRKQGLKSSRKRSIDLLLG